MPVDLVNSFAEAYKQGASIRNDQEQQRLYEDTKNTFADVMKNKDKYGGEEGAFREAAKRFGESGNIKGFEMATQTAVQFQEQKKKQQAEAMNHLGAAAFWLYDKKGEEKQKAYGEIYNHYKELGVPVENWPKPGSYTDEVGFSMTGTETSRKFFEDITYKKAQAEAAKTRAEAAKTAADKKPAGGKGAGSKTKIVQIQEAMVAAKYPDPKTGKPVTAARALELAQDWNVAAKHQDDGDFYTTLRGKGWPHKAAIKAVKERAQFESDSASPAASVPGSSGAAGGTSSEFDKYAE